MNEFVKKMMIIKRLKGNLCMPIWKLNLSVIIMVITEGEVVETDFMAEEEAEAEHIGEICPKLHVLDVIKLDTSLLPVRIDY